MRIAAILATELFDPNVEYAAFQSEIENEGAIVTFVGIARPHSTTGSEISCLFLDHHPRLTQLSLGEIANDAVRRYDDQ